MDGASIDSYTILVALAAILVRPLRRKFKDESPCFVLRDVVVDFLNGTVIVPFLLLVGSVFSPVLMQEALKLNRVGFAIGGVIGLLFVLRELFANSGSDDQPARRIPRSPYQ